jgi:hypothetical protein
MKFMKFYVLYSKAESHHIDNDNSKLVIAPREQYVCKYRNKSR